MCREISLFDILLEFNVSDGRYEGNNRLLKLNDQEITLRW